MAKYFILYRVPVATMEKWRAETSPEEIQAQSEKLMKDMHAWMEKHAGAFVENGQPLGRTKSVTASGIVDTKNDLNYYCVVEAPSHEAAAHMFADNPHLVISDSSIDVMEIPHAGL